MYIYIYNRGTASRRTNGRTKRFKGDTSWPCPGFPVASFFVTGGQHRSFKGDTSWSLALVAILGVSKVILRGPHRLFGRFRSLETSIAIIPMPRGGPGYHSEVLCLGSTFGILSPHRSIQLRWICSLGHLQASFRLCSVSACTNIQDATLLRARVYQLHAHPMHKKH